MPTDDPPQVAQSMAVQGNTVHYACGIWQTAPKHEASVFGVVEFKPHHRGPGAYTWPPTIRSAEPSKALTSTKCCPQPEVERGTSKVLQNGTGSRPHLQGAVHPEPEADAPM